MPAAAATLPPAIRVKPKARRWRYSQGAIRRCIPDRGGDSHHPRRPFAAVLSLYAFMAAPSCHVSHDAHVGTLSRRFSLQAPLVSSANALSRQGSFRNTGPREVAGSRTSRVRAEMHWGATELVADRRTRADERSSVGRFRHRQSANDRKEAPCLRNALELVIASILELEPRAGDEILDRARNEHLAGSRER